jgi:hypothetical protein
VYEKLLICFPESVAGISGRPVSGSFVSSFPWPVAFAKQRRSIIAKSDTVFIEILHLKCELRIADWRRVKLCDIGERYG